MKELSPLKKKRMECIAQAEASFSSPSSLSSLSPDRSSRPSSERESQPDDLELLLPLTSSLVEVAVSSTKTASYKQELHDDAATVTSTKKLSVQPSLEMELFGVSDMPDTSGVDRKLETGATPVAAAALIRPKQHKKKSSSTKNRSSAPLKGTREVITINTIKGTVTSSIIPIARPLKSNQKNSQRPSNSSTLTKNFKDENHKSLAAGTNGLETRRLSLLHSDQIVAAAINRYKNHFYILAEDSDSTVASNPSSTGADTLHVALEYPGKDSREKFTLMKPFLSRSKSETDDKDEYNPIEDVVQTVHAIIQHFFSPERTKELFGTPDEGLYRNLTKFKIRKDGAQFMKTLEEFNQIMKREKTSGAVQDYVKRIGYRQPYELVVHILQQVYSRTVAARASKLNQYEAFSNNVYGEILPILTKEFIQRTKLDQSKVFVDLGCGIGNVVLQVALQTGAEAYGVEIMDTPAKFSKKQAKEFEARCRAYGLEHGPVTMIQGDFLDTPGLPAILARADVVLVNNYAFNSALNQSLLRLFLDLKEGCKIISLKTFVSLDHRINVRNAGSVESILRVKKYPYYTNAVSWTHNGGEYFVATVDRAPVQAFWERAMADGGAPLDDGGRRSSRRR
ncbi:Nucleosomal histone H3-Lys79 methylase [Dissophora globulifera]|uniref:Histone-lysine N-methyltransferase, H3 lysine-79 specific n=1 Tax=Dissophora globulifera TaxID=979702 RepID=A0A9P6R0Z8_9FUNG|nr:Nucleosomal histone H3-Lys79 methylase [Dissophora globulifera]